MASLYADENFPLEVVEALRRLGHDVLTAQEAGQANRAIPDEEVLDFAVERKRAVLTLNRRQFIRLHTARPRHSGVIVCTVDPDVGRQAARIDEGIRNASSLEGTSCGSTVPPEQSTFFWQIGELPERLPRLLRQEHQKPLSHRRTIGDVNPEQLRDALFQKRMKPEKYEGYDEKVRRYADEILMNMQRRFNYSKESALDTILFALRKRIIDFDEIIS